VFRNRPAHLSPILDLLEWSVLLEGMLFELAPKHKTAAMRHRSEILGGKVGDRRRRRDPVARRSAGSMLRVATVPYLRIDFNLAFRTASCGLTVAPSSQRCSC